MILLQMIAIGVFGLLMIYKPWREPEPGEAAGRVGNLKPVNDARPAEPNLKFSA